MQETQTLYEAIKKADEERHVLLSVQNLLMWDQETYIPPAATSFRAKQVELLAKMAHDHLVCPEFRTLLEKLIDFSTGSFTRDDLSDEQKAALQMWRRDVALATKLPTEFVSQFASLTSQAHTAWVEAKQTRTFSTFAPLLEKIVDACKKKADLIGYEAHPYDALIDEFEMGMTHKKLSSLFSELKPALIELIQKAKRKKDPPSFLYASYDEGKQLTFCKELLEKMGIDSSRSRLDQAHHPFCMPVHPNDMRMTTHTDLSHFFNNISATLHEGGHCLYELGLPVDEYGTPLCESASLGIHESQSRFWECYIGLSKPFISYLHKEIQTRFPSELEGVDEETFYDGLTSVNPSLIRIFADEATYCLHVILRFEIESALIEGSLAVEDVPEAWDTKMQEYFGITPDSVSEGCLQDIHWAHGGFGYFPTYALGNLYAAALFEQFTTDHPDWAERVRQGDMHFIRDFLIQKVHMHGRQFSPEELIKRATGKALSIEPYMRYLEAKYA